MDTTYRLSQTGKDVQQLLDQVTPNQNAIGQETLRATEAESKIQQELDDEIQRSTETDTSLGNSITQEEQRATDAEQVLQQNIDAEVTARTQDVDTEEQRAKAAEALLQQHIDEAVSGGGADVTAERERAETAERQLQDNIDTEQQRAETAEQSLQDNIDTEARQRQAAVSQEQQRAEGVEGDLQADIDDINAKIPAAASSSNQLVDKQFVNSTVATATADFKGTFNSKGELDQVTANANDYAYVVSKDTEGNTVYSRYKWVDGTGWMFEYNLNNSSFTAAQWAAIQSGITALLVAKLAGLPTNDVLTQLIGTKQDRLTFDTEPTRNSTNPVQSGGVFEALGHKQEQLTFDDEPTRNSANPVKSGGLYSLFQSIVALFPEDATPQNKLATKTYVDDKAKESAAGFIGVFASVDVLDDVRGMTVNDYAFVTGTDADGNQNYTRYDYNGAAWEPIYTLSNNNFTQAQWQSIQSGITALLVEKLNALPTAPELADILTGKQDRLTFDTTPRTGSQNPVTSEGIALAILASSGVQFVNVDVLPDASAATMGKIYIVPNATDPNASDWYVTTYDGTTTPGTFSWQNVNTTSVDLSDYYTKSEVDRKVDNLSVKDGEKNVTVETANVPGSTTLTYTNALGNTAAHIVGDKRIVPNPEAESGYDVYFLLHIDRTGDDPVATWGKAGGSADIRQQVWISLASNQGSADTGLNGVPVKVETSDGETVLDTTWQGETLYVRVAPLLHVTVTVGRKGGYALSSDVQEFDSVVSGERVVTFNYQTCVVTFQPVSSQGAGDTAIQQAKGTVNGVAVSYGDTLKVPLGDAVTVICGALENYTTPANYTGTADVATLMPTLVYQTTLVTVSWESNLGADAVIDAVQAQVAGRTVSSGQTIKVATGTTVSVVFPDVEGYRTPSVADFTAEGLSVTKPTVQYQTDVYTVSIDSNQSDKTDISGVEVTVAYGQVEKILTDGETIKVPTGTVPTATATTVSGYRKTVSVNSTLKTVTAQYDTTVVSVNAISNQSTQQQTDPVLTGLTFTVNGTEVPAGQGVKVPTGDTLTVTAPDVTDYAKQITADATAAGAAYTVIVSYQATLVGVNIVSDIAGIETSAPMGAQATVNYDGGQAQTITNGQYAKVPTGTQFTVTYGDVTNYAAPNGWQQTAEGTSMTAPKAAYVQGLVTIAVAMSDGDQQALALAGATVAINGGTPVAYTGSPVAVAPLSNVVVAFGGVSGYQTPAQQSFVMPTGTKAIDVTYLTTLVSVQMVGVESGTEGNPPQGAQATVSYQGGTDQTIQNGQTAKVPTGTEFIVTYADVENYGTPSAYTATASGSTMQAPKAQYVNGSVTVNLSMSDNDADALTLAKAYVAVDGGTPVAYAGTPIAVAPGSQVEVTFDDVEGYATPATRQFIMPSTAYTVNAEYQTSVYTVYISSNQPTDATIAAKTVRVSYTGLATPKQVGNNGTVKVPAGLTPTATADDVTGYAKDVTVNTTAKTITVAYQTTIVSVNMVGVSGGVEGSAPTGAGATVRYQGGADQHITNATTANVPTGTAFTIEYDAVQNYGTPATYSATASGASMTAPKAQYVYGVLNVEVGMSDNDNTDLAEVTAQIAVNGGSPTAMQGTVDTTTHKKTFTTTLNVGEEYEITFGSVEGYATPAAITGEKGSGVETKTAEYETDIYTLTVTGQSRDETIEYTQGGQTVSKTLSSGNSVKVPAGTAPTVASAYVKGYARSVSVGTVTSHAATITVAYSTTAYSVNMTSNQTGDQVIAAMQATVGWTYDGHTESETLSSGDTVNVPTGITPTVTFPDAAGYTKTVTSSGTAYTAAYTTEIITVILVSDTGEADLSGVTITFTDTTASAVVTPFATRQYKIPSGHGYKVEVSDDVEGYKAPDAVTGTATSGTDAALTVTMTYEEQAGFVDLGLPSGKKWAQGNLVKDSQGNYSIGAETDWGTYVSWGNIIGHNEGEGYNFDQTTYDSTPGKQVAANIPSNDAAHDIALAKLGTPWHLPTKEDFQELYDNTDSEWVADYNGTGVAGRKFMKKSDHSVFVFFPASGDYNGTSLYDRGTGGLYWSASFFSSTRAYRLYFNSSSVNPQYDFNRRIGLTVRPVQ